MLISLVQTFLTNFTLLFFILFGIVTLVVRQHIGGLFLASRPAPWWRSPRCSSGSFVLAVRRQLRRRTLLRLAIAVHRVGRRFTPRWTPRRGRLWRFQHQLNQGFDFLLKRKERMVAPTAVDPVRLGAHRRRALGGVLGGRTIRCRSAS